MRIGMLTAGGDCPGLNAVIRAIVRSAIDRGDEAVGILRGYQGLAQSDYMELDQRTVAGILPLGGTILRTSSFEPLTENAVDRVAFAFERDRLDAVVAIGGEHTMEITRMLHEERGPAADRRPEDDRQRHRRHRLHLRLRHGRPRGHGGDRPPPHDRPVPRPADGRRGDGPQRRLDRAPRRPRRRRRRDPHPRGRHARRGARGGRDPPPRARQGLLDHRRRRGREPRFRERRGPPGPGQRGDRRVRLRAARRDRQRPGDRARADDRLRGPHGGPRPRPARRHPDRPRPDPRHALRRRGLRAGPGRTSSAGWSPCTATR